MSVTTKTSKRRATGFARALMALALCALYAPAAFAAKSKHAAMVMDANTGRILYSDAADALRHPASLTKMMTIYMAFDLLKQGRLTQNTLITISKTAAAQPPSKFGLKPGRKIKLIHAIKALVTKSANDVAVAIAEHIGGSERNFAALMTSKARSLGMTRTVFKNASGLPDSAQVTTSRDMLVLALALQDNFPKLYPLFKTRYFTYNGKTYKNHNTLLGRVSGVDGIKTGYIRASGFNLVTSMRKNGRHIVAAVFGGRTARRRNTRMRGLLKRYLHRGSTKRTRRARPLLVASRKRAAPPKRVAPPNRRPAQPSLRDLIGAPVRATAKRRASPTQNPRVVKAARRAPARTQPSVTKVELLSAQTNAVVPTPRTPTQINAVAMARPAGNTVSRRPDGRIRGRPPSTLQDQLADLLAQNHSATTHQYGSAPATTARVSSASKYVVQIGAYATPAEARRSLTSVTQRAPDLVGRYHAITQSVDSGNRTLYRARFKGFSAAATARSTCKELKKQAIDCLVTR